MHTLKTTHLGDGAYVGIDPYLVQIWLGANHHANMSVALGPLEIEALMHFLMANFPMMMTDIIDGIRKAKVAPLDQTSGA